MNCYSIWMSDHSRSLVVPLRVVSRDPVPCEQYVNGSLHVSDPFLFAPLPSLYTTTMAPVVPLFTTSVTRSYVIIFLSLISDF